jgi:hypothetical protein
LKEGLHNPKFATLAFVNSMELKQQIAQWKAALLAMNKRDVLVNLTAGKNALLLKESIDFGSQINLEPERLLNKLFKDHRNSIKESGTPIFGVSKNLLEFEFQHEVFASPLFIANCSIHKNRYNKTYAIEQVEQYYLNPFLIKKLSIDEKIEDQDELIEWLTAKKLAYSIKEGYWCANFHPHRYILFKELERIESLDTFGSNLTAILGKTAQPSNEIKLHEGQLFSSDDDQLEAFNVLQSENLVLQGPPGTGKSQVIGNLLSKLLIQPYNGLLVAEKKVALQVIYDQLKPFNLHHYCLLHHHELNPKDFITSLKKTWHFLEQRKIMGKPHVQTSKMALDHLGLSLQRLRQKDLIGGIDFSSFRALNLNSAQPDSLFIADLPDIPTWQSEKPKIAELAKLMGKSKSWTYLKNKKDRNYIVSLEKGLQRMTQLIKQIGFNDLTKHEINNLIRKAGTAALFFYDDLLLPPAIFDSERELQKKFIGLYNEFLKLNEEFALLESEKKHWKKTFSLSELQEYIKLLSSAGRFNFKLKYYRNKLLKFTDLNLHDAQSALKNLLHLKEIEQRLIAVRQAFREMGLSDDSNELKHIKYVIRRAAQSDQNLIRVLVRLPKEELQRYNALSSSLHELNDLVFKFLLIDEREPIEPIVAELLNALSDLSQIGYLIEDVSPATKKIYRKEENIDEIERIIFQGHWKKFKGRFPQLAQLDGEKLAQKMIEIASFQQNEYDLFSSLIHDSKQEIFESYHQLLQIPARKLSEEQKHLKKKLRKGKSILVKAFAKSRSFPSIHDLLDSDARIWINLLHPLFLCSPYTVAKSIPLDQIFDVVIFDEASQLPFSHAIGSIQRSKRLVIAGDQQQMAPHSYFQKVNKTHDLLHQASFYFRNVLLTNHYRSSHERLIAYSNRYFYEGKLRTYPKPTTTQPIEVINAGGNFIERQNKAEAKVAAKAIQQQLEKGNKELGIVAFSKTQLSAILDELPAALLDEIMDENYPGFVQSLENVQGDQCNHLIISMGYAPNEQNAFHMRFGPLNQEQGHRRLNVLMSRAKEKITFIRSVSSEDFQVSSNEGIEALRKLMLFLEETDHTEKHEFPNGITQEKSQLTIHQPHFVFSSANELVNYDKVMRNRGWEIKLNI